MNSGKNSTVTVKSVERGKGGRTRGEKNWRDRGKTGCTDMDVRRRASTVPQKKTHEQAFARASGKGREKAGLWKQLATLLSEDGATTLGVSVGYYG